MKILNRYDNSCQWEGVITIEGTEAEKLGAAIKQALKEGANLKGSNLEGSNLKGSNLAWSSLKGSNLEGSNLEGSNLEGSNLAWSNLKGSNLEGSNLEGSNLEGSNLEGSNLEGSNLAGSNMVGCMRDEDAKIARLDVCEWPVTIQYDGVHIGCKTFSVAEILVMTEEIAATHHANAPIRWRRWGKALQALAVATLGNPKASRKKVTP